MQLLTAKIFVLIVFFIDNIQTEISPDGENVCLKAETYEEKMKVTVRKPAVVKKKKWCWSIRKRFSCSRSVTKWEDVTELRAFNRTRIVPKCCDGYKEERKQLTKCSPVCLKGCINGKCVAPEICACFSGFFGSECEKECSDGLWGENCANRCDCASNGKCDKTTGVCECEQGWTGDRCEFPCQSGYYGYLCKMKCNCGNVSCNHKTGECFTTTALATQALLEVSTVTESVATEIILEAYRPSETSKSFTEVSVSDFSKTSEADAPEVIGDFAEKSSAEEMMTIFAVMDVATSTTTAALDFSEMTEPSKNAEETTSSDLISGATTPSTNIFTSEMNTAETSRVTDRKLINVVESGISFSDGSETSTNNVDNNNEEREATNNVNQTLSLSVNNPINDTTGINFRGNEQYLDKTETDNFINEKKGSSNKKTTIKIIHFLPGLFLFSSISFLTFVIAAMWLVNKHRNKTRKILASAEKKDKIFQLEDQIKYPAENFFWSNNCTNNPVYLSDVDLSRTTPVLETFKPLNSDSIPRIEKFGND